MLSQQRYLPFGGVRTDLGPITQTDFGFTGQRNLPDPGLMDYNARMYDPALGRFIQPDSIVPGLADPQSWNRFAYVLNNPIQFIDPSGYTTCLGGNWDDGPQCKSNPSSKDQYDITKHPENFRDDESGGSASNCSTAITLNCLLGGVNGLSGSPLVTVVPPGPACTISACVQKSQNSVCPIDETCLNVPTYWDLNPQHPDYTALTVNIFFVAAEITKDRYGHYYFGPGITANIKTFLPVGVVSSGGYIGSSSDNSMPNFAETESFLTGPALNGGGVVGTLGGGVTFSPITWIWKGINLNSHESPVAWETSTNYVPSAGITATWNISLP